MLILVTGVPGASKTLNTIKMVCEDARFVNRPVFYHGIPECRIPGWVAVDADQVRKWDELEPRSVLIIDEAYELFPAMATGAKPPAFIEKLARHRHFGLDIIFICQHPHQLVTFVRKMVGNHYHYERPFGMKYARCFEWQKVVNDPDDHFARKDALVRKVRMDKKYFGLYKSAEAHTHKVRIPKKAYFILAVLVLVVGGFIRFGLDMASRGSDEASSVVSSMTPAGALAATFSAPAEVVPQHEGRGGRLPRDPEAYAREFAPRVRDMPFTAPAFDAAFQVKSFPRPQCVLSVAQAKCQCYSQQGSKMDIAFEMCQHYVENGWFDPTVDDGGREALGPQALAQMGGQVGSVVPVSSVPEREPKAFVVQLPHTPQVAAKPASFR
jgi:zona occludens toxin